MIQYFHLLRQLVVVKEGHMGMQALLAGPAAAEAVLLVRVVLEIPHQHRQARVVLEEMVALQMALAAVAAGLVVLVALELPHRHQLRVVLEELALPLQYLAHL